MSNIHFKTAFSNIRRSPFQAFAAIFVLTITFFVATTLAILIYSSDKILTYFETRPQVIAFLKDEATPDKISQLQDRLNQDFRVKEVGFISKENALQIYKDATSDNPLLSELVSPSIFPASLEFSLRDINFAQEVITEIKKEPVVDQVGFTASLGGESNLNDTVEKLRTITFYIRVGGGIFAGMLIATSLIVLLVIISMRLTSRRQEVEILDLIGATSGFIKKPIIIEAFTYSVIGVFMGWIFSLILILYSAPSVVSYFKEIPVLPKDPVYLFILFAIILGVEMLIGLLLAIFGSSLAVARVRKS